MAEGLELHVFDVGLGEEEDGEVDHALAFEAGVVAKGFYGGAGRGVGLLLEVDVLDDYEGFAGFVG